MPKWMCQSYMPKVKLKLMVAWTSFATHFSEKAACNNIPN